MAVWNLRSLPTTREESILWAKQQRLLPQSKNCYRHRCPMVIDEDLGVAGRFRCSKSNNCRRTFVANNTFFSETRMPLASCIGLLYYAFSQDWPHDQARRELQDTSIPVENRELLGSDTIHYWYNFCREMVVDYYTTIQSLDELLGGPGTIVQIEESLFGHRKYERGRYLKGKWVLGMIENEREDVRMIVVDTRDANTLIPLIQNHVKPGTEIHTDKWRAYDGLEAAGYIHKTVNHSDLVHRFVAVDGTHTQRIEATWRPAKEWFRGRHIATHDFGLYLCQYLWQRHCKKNGLDSFESLLNAIRSSYQV